MHIPLKLAENVINSLGNQGKIWLDSLAFITSKLIDKWQLTEIVPVSNMSYNYVCLARSQLYQMDVVLKISAFKEDLRHELKALTAYRNKLCVKLIDYDMACNAILLERIIPGTSLKSFFPGKESEAIEITAYIIQNLHSISLENYDQYQKLTSWFGCFNQPTSVPEKYVIKAKNLIADLSKKDNKLVLLHGDLQHNNILFDGEKWVAIDPKGVLGPLGYEVGAFVYNPIPELLSIPNPKEIIINRMLLFSKLLNIEANTIKDYTFVMAALSATWFGDGGGDTKGMNYMLKIIELVESI